MSRGSANKRVLRIIARLNVGGPARQAYGLTHALRDSHPTRLLAGTPTPDEAELFDDRVLFTRIALTRPISPVADLKSVQAVRRHIVEFDPRIVHTHTAKAGTVGRAAALTFRKPNRPRTVHTFHGHVLDGYFSGPKERVFIEIERRLAKSTDLLIAVSPQTRDSLLDLGIGRPNQYQVVPLGLDLSAFADVDDPRGLVRQELGLAPTTPLVGIVGRLAPIKNHKTLLRAMELLPEAHLAVVGDGDTRTDLEGQVNAAGMAGRVHFLGWRDDLADIYSDLDVVALTSLNEGTPVALIEAMASGRPVVGTDVGGVRFVIEHGESGLLAPSGDEHAIAERIREVLNDRKLRDRLVENARPQVFSRFGEGRLIADIAAIYDELAARR